MLARKNGKAWIMDALKVVIGVGVIALLSGANLGKYTGAFVQVADVAAAKSRGMNEEALLIECRSLLAQQRRAEIYDVAYRGYSTFHTNEWQYLYGKACAFRYEDRRDFSALKKAEKLFRAYVNEIPYDSMGHVDWGWSLSHLGRPDEARREFLKALALDPDNWVARDKLKYVQPSSTMQEQKHPVDFKN